MSGVIIYQAPVKVCWKPSISYETLIPGLVLIDSPFFELENGTWRFSLHSSKANIFLFQIRSNTFLIPDKFRCNVRIEQNDGTCVLNEDAIYVNTEMYQLLISSDVIASCFSNKELGRFVCTVFNKAVFARDGNLLEVLLEDHKRNVSSQTISLESVEKLSENFKDLLERGEHADVKIKVGTREFKAHRLVLATRSPVLDSMFSNDMLKKNSEIVTISDCDEEAFSGFLTFLYSGKIHEVNSKKIADLYEISDKYGLLDLKKECVKRLNVEMSVELVCDALRVATLHQEEELLENATNFFIFHAEEVLHSSEWDTFSNEYPKIGNNLFKKYVKKAKMK